MKNHPLVLHFIALVDGWNAAGWGEFLLWETLEGTRDRPFKLMDKLPEADMEVLRRLRDELKVWPYWDGPTQQWDIVDMDAWRPFAAETPANLILTAMERR